MKSLKLITMATLASMLLASSSFAATYVLHYNKHIKTNGGVKTLKLKNKLQNAYGANTNQLELKSVILVAKSKHGNGKALLKVGNATTGFKVVPGQPFKFHQAGYFYQKVFFNPKANSNGVWQLKLKGNFKVKRVIVKAVPKTKVISLNYYGNEFNGSNILYLKQKLASQYGINANSLKLQSVILVAKSFLGQGKAQLKVKNSLGAKKKVKGNPIKYISGGNFKQVYLPSPAPFANGGAWQIGLQGKIKVKKVILKVSY